MAKPNTGKFNNISLDGLGLGPLPKDEPMPSSKLVVKKREAKPSASYEENMQKLKKRAAEALAKTQATATDVVLKRQVSIEERVLQQSFPGWDDENRAVPNPFVRSGLFSVKNSKNEDRGYLDKLVLPSLSNYRIEYSGRELQQDDLSVWLFLINLAKNQPIADCVYFTGYQIVTDLSWTLNSKSYLRAKQCIERLKVTGLEISSVSPESGAKEQAYSGSLIREYSWDARDGTNNPRWMVRFEPKISLLFLEDTTTFASWEIRKRIGSRHTVAQWLHYYFESHKKPFPISVRKVHELSRSGDTVSSFRNTVKRALDKLVEVGFLTEYAIENDKIIVIQNDRLRIKDESEKPKGRRKKT